MPRQQKGQVVRVDLHCHSCASNEASEAVLNAIACPESYSTPEQVYDQARRRGMDFVTITDHDSIDGVIQLARHTNVVVGEEVSCFFPEDGCKVHLLVWGIDAQEHEELQRRAQDIYELARYIAEHRIAHSLAHPLYRNNDRLQRWHLENLLLMFKGFEVINGAHSGLHRDVFQQVLDELTAQRIETLSRQYQMSPLWPQPHIKARTGGSDDHGLLNIGRTWTEFPDHVRTTADLLECIRQGECRAGGEAGAAIKLAHQFYSVAVRYFSREMLPAGHTPSLPTMLLQTFIGEAPVSGRRQLMKLAIRHKLKKFSTKLLKPWKNGSASGGAAKLLGKPFLKSARERIGEHPALLEALSQGDAPLSQHDAMFGFVRQLNADITTALAEEMHSAVRNGQFSGIFDSISAHLAQQFISLPYYFAFFHQNKERSILREMAGLADPRRPEDLKIGLFTDTLDEVNGVSRFVRDMAEQAQQQHLHLLVHTCSREMRFALPNRHNFSPAAVYPLPYYPELSLNIPPLLEILEWADRQQFDAIEVSTPGPMGLAGMLVAQMLRIPLLATYHTDFPAYVMNFSGDHRLTDLTLSYMKWFYGRCDKVFTRSRQYTPSLCSLGIPPERIAMAMPGIDTRKFNPRFRSSATWVDVGVTQLYKIIYCGRVSREKNLPLLEKAFSDLARRRKDVALVVVGDGPYRAEMQKRMRSQPVYFLGYRFDEELSRLYASADLSVFPSRTDTLGQVVGEAQASGLPVLVGDEGGPKEMMDHGVSGLVLSSTDPAPWTEAMDELLSNDLRRRQMARNAVTRVGRFSLKRSFMAYWMEHAACILPNIEQPTHEDQPADAPVA